MDKACEIIKDTQTIACIRGVASQMIILDIFYGLVLEEILLRHTNNLSRTLQHSNFSAAEGQAVVAMTVTTLTTLRNDDNYDKFWKKVKKMVEERVCMKQYCHKTKSGPVGTCTSSCSFNH